MKELERERAGAAEQGGEVRALAQDIAPIDDVRPTTIYRSRVTGNVLFRILQE